MTPVGHRFEYKGVEMVTIRPDEGKGCSYKGLHCSFDSEGMGVSGCWAARDITGEGCGTALDGVMYVPLVDYIRVRVGGET